MEIIRARYNYRQPRPRKRRLRLIVFLLVLIVLFTSGGYSYAALQKPDPHLAVQPTEIKPPAVEALALAWPAGGQAAIGSLEQGLLAQSVPTETPQPIASITKVVTALTILQKAPLKPGEPGVIYTFDDSDVVSYRTYLAKQGSVVPVSVGQTMTQAQALEYLLVISANNLADSMVRRHFASTEDFLAAANALTKSYNMNQTIITDASGFAPTTVSTASDLIILGTKALAEPAIASFVATKTVHLSGYGVVQNSNQLLKDPDIIGIKTGTTDEAGRCLLFAARHAIDNQHSVTIIGVVLGSQNNTNLYAGVRNLLSSARQGFGAVEMFAQGTKVGSISTDWGQTTELVTDSSLQVYGWKAKLPEITVDIKPGPLPLPAGTSQGRVTMSDGQTTAIVNQSALSPAGSWWKLRNYF